MQVSVEAQPSTHTRPVVQVTATAIVPTRDGTAGSATGISGSVGSISICGAIVSSMHGILTSVEYLVQCVIPQALMLDLHGDEHLSLNHNRYQVEKR